MTAIFAVSNATIKIGEPYDNTKFMLGVEDVATGLVPLIPLLTAAYITTLAASTSIAPGYEVFDTTNRELLLWDGSSFTAVSNVVASDIAVNKAIGQSYVRVVSDTSPVAGQSLVAISATEANWQSISQDLSGYASLSGADFTGPITTTTTTNNSFTVKSTTSSVYTTLDSSSYTCLLRYSHLGTPAWSTGLNSNSNYSIINNTLNSNALVIDSNSNKLTILGGLDAGSYITAAGYKTSTGLSTQFLKADGSIDSNTYALASNLSAYALLSGATFTGDVGIYRMQGSASLWAISTVGSSVVLLDSGASSSGMVIRTGGVNKWSIGLNGTDTLTISNYTVGGDALTVNSLTNTISVVGLTAASQGLTLSSATPTSTTNTLYNVSGDLTWAGKKLLNATSDQAISGINSFTSVVKMTGYAGLSTTTDGSSITIAGGMASPFAGRIFFGDGTGWKFGFSKRTSGTITDYVTIQDNGTLSATTINATTVNGTFVGNGASLTNLPSDSTKITKAGDTNVGLLTVLATGGILSPSAAYGIRFNYGSLSETYSESATVVGNNIYVSPSDTVSQVRTRNTHASYGHSLIWMSNGETTIFGKTESVTANNVVVKNQIAKFTGTAITLSQNTTANGTLTSSAQGLTLSSATPISTTNTLYNISGSLYWNGSQLTGIRSYPLTIGNGVDTTFTITHNLNTNLVDVVIWELTGLKRKVDSGVDIRYISANQVSLNFGTYVPAVSSLQVIVYALG